MLFQVAPGRTKRATAFVAAVSFVYSATASAPGGIAPPRPDYAWAFDEGQGDRAGPFAGGVVGRIAGARWSATARFPYAGNRSLYFDGQAAAVSLDGVRLAGEHGGLTVSAWVREVAWK